MTARAITASRTAVLTTTALVAFAANSILTRAALGSGEIDAASFSAVRLASGAVTLFVVLRLSDARGRGSSRRWSTAVLLFLYAVPFSFAYLDLSTGTGALLLFGAVQVTMLLAAIGSGERPGARQWTGLVLAFGGLAYLVSPGLQAPAPFGSLLMALAGIAWGLYSLRGRLAEDPLAATAGNFLWALPLVAVVVVVAAATDRGLVLGTRGVLLAVASGAVASGGGYVSWYAALRGLSATRAAIVQLAVPILAAAGGVLFMREVISMRLLLSATVVLGGVALALTHRDRVTAAPATGR